MFSVCPRDNGEVKRDGRFVRVLGKSPLEERVDVNGRAEEALMGVFSSRSYCEFLSCELSSIFSREMSNKYLTACRTVEMRALDSIVLNALEPCRV